MTLEKKIINHIFKKFHIQNLNYLQEEPMLISEEISSLLNEELLKNSNNVSFNNSSFQIHIRKEIDFLNIDYIPEYSEHLDFLFEIISQPEFSPKIKTLNLSYKYGSANGWMIVALKNLLKGNVSYINLINFIMALESEDTDMIEIIYDYSPEFKNNICGLILDSMPNIQKLTLLTSPSEKDLKREKTILKTLLVKCIFDNKDFIKNLANSICFEELEYFSFFDVDSCKLDDESQNTNFESYLELFNSKSLPKLKVLDLNNVSLNNEQIEILKKQPLINQLQILNINTQKYGNERIAEVNITSNKWFFHSYLLK